MINKTNSINKIQEETINKSNNANIKDTEIDQNKSDINKIENLEIVNSVKSENNIDKNIDLIPYTNRSVNDKYDISFVNDGTNSINNSTRIFPNLNNFT